MNYAALFRATLPETALEVAALLVLVVDLCDTHRKILLPLDFLHLASPAPTSDTKSIISPMIRVNTRQTIPLYRPAPVCIYVSPKREGQTWTSTPPVPCKTS